MHLHIIMYYNLIKIKLGHHGIAPLSLFFVCVLQSAKVVGIHGDNDDYSSNKYQNSPTIHFLSHDYIKYTHEFLHKPKVGTRTSAWFTCHKTKTTHST